MSERFGRIDAEREQGEMPIRREAMPRSLVLALMTLPLACACAETPTAPPPPAASFDPSSGCQRALSRVIDLAVQATGAGPTDAQRSQFLARCVEARSERGAECVLHLKRLPGKRGGAVQLGPALGCLRPDRS